MAKIRRSGGGPTKKKKASPGKSRKKGDLEDLYLSVVSAEKLAKKERKKQKTEQEDRVVEEEDALCLIDAAFTPIIKHDMNTLLGLLEEDGQTEGREESEEEREKDEDGMVDEEEEEEEEEEEVNLDNEEDLSDSEENREKEEEEFLWDGFKFDSFNNRIPEIAESTDKSAVEPPGFSPFLLGEENAALIRTLISDMSQTPPDLIGKEASVPYPFLDQKIWERWRTNVVPKILEKERRWYELANRVAGVPYLSSVQSGTLFQLMSNYVDIVMSDQTFINSSSLRALSVMHVISHISRIRNRQSQNNRKLRQLVEEHKATEPVQRGTKRGPPKCQATPDSSTPDPSGDDQFRDQGFTRPKVLILTPTRQTAKDIIELMLDLLPAKQVRLRKRFEKEFSSEDCNSSKERMDESNGASLIEKGKPADFIELFRGNISEEFLLGIRIHQSNIHLFSTPYDSDVIVASSLGLRLIVGTEGLNKREFDFLSSIEVLLIDRADVLRMQNWEHVRDILDVINRQPTQWRPECDIRRLRSSYLEGLARNFRQTIILSSGRRPDVNSLFSSTDSSGRPFCENFRGFVKLSVSSLGVPVRDAALRVSKQLFLNVPCQSIKELNEALYNFMARQFPPTFISVGDNDSVLLVVPSYIEYLQVRRTLKKSQLAAQDSRDFTQFVSCHEYSSNSNLTKSRNAFLSGHVKLMITTERFLFYRRYIIRGAAHVVFMGAPDYPEIYSDCLTSLKAPTLAISCVVYTKFHAPAVERLVGSAMLKTLLNNTSTNNKLFVLG